MSDLEREAGLRESAQLLDEQWAEERATHNPYGEAFCGEQAFDLVCGALGALDYTATQAVGMALGASATLAAIRDVLGCEPGGEVGAVRELKVAHSDALLEAAKAAVYTGPPAPGDVLDPADFGKGEAGVLRLAALLSEAPEGAVVRDTSGDDWTPDSECAVVGWWSSLGDGAEEVSHLMLARCAPLTVVAWPS